MIKCKYCDNEMECREVHFFSTWKQIIKCNKHLPVKVGFTPANGSRFGAKWVISYNDYRLVYYTLDDKTIFQLRHPEENVERYYENMKKFEGELSITPEQFPDKIKTLLMWS